MAGGEVRSTGDGWMDGVSTRGMDDWLPSEPVKPEERVPGGGEGGWGGAERRRPHLKTSQRGIRRFSFYRNVLSACARSLSTSAFFPPSCANFSFFFSAFV